MKPYFPRIYRRSRSLLPCLITLCLLFPSAGIHSYSPGKWLFEQAYRLEKKDPEKAVRLYRAALRRGLNWKLRRAARWRLFYLYSELGQFVRALRLIKLLGSSSRIEIVADNLYKAIARRLRLNRAALRDYLTALSGLRGIPLISTARYKFPGVAESRSVSFVYYFKEALRKSPRNPELRLAIIKNLREAGREDLVEQLREGYRYRRGFSELARASHLFFTGKTKEAENILWGLARDRSEMVDEVKIKILYLLGRISRKRRDYRRAALYFRLAARYGRGNGAHRYDALAAYALYRAGFPGRARALFQNLPPFQEWNIRLLRLILRAETKRDPRALRAIRSMRKRLISLKRRGRDSYLTRRALRILRAKGRRIRPPRLSGKSHPTPPGEADVFWNRETRAFLGSELLITVGNAEEIAIFRQWRNVQFYGSWDSYRGRPIRLLRGRAVPRKIADISSFFQKRKGYFVPLIFPAARPKIIPEKKKEIPPEKKPEKKKEVPPEKKSENKKEIPPEKKPEIKTEKIPAKIAPEGEKRKKEEQAPVWKKRKWKRGKPFRLAVFPRGSERYVIVNMRSNGRTLWIEAERKPGPNSPGLYFTWTVQRVFLEQK